MTSSSLIDVAQRGISTSCTDEFLLAQIHLLFGGDRVPLVAKAPTNVGGNGAECVL